MKLEVIKGAGGAEFGERLKDFRNQRGLSQRQIATALDVTAAAVCNWENGKARPRPAKIAGLAATLNVSIDQLLGAESADNPRITASANTVIYRAREDIAAALSGDVDHVRVFVDERDTHPVARKVGRTRATLGVASLFGLLCYPLLRK